MLSLFLQLAPDRVRRLSAAAGTRDAETLIQDATKMQSAAESINAEELAIHARAIAAAAGEEDFARASESLTCLEREINRLSAADRHPAAAQ